MPPAPCFFVYLFLWVHILFPQTTTSRGVFMSVQSPRSPGSASHLTLSSIASEDDNFQTTADLTKSVSDQVKEKIKFAAKIIMIAAAIVGIIVTGVASFFLGGVPAIILGACVWALLNYTATPITEALISKYLPRHLDVI